MLDGLRGLLAAEFEIAGTVTDGLAAIESYKQLTPDLLMLDISLPLLNGIEVARKITGMSPAARIVFVTMHTDKNYVEQAFRAGAAGYVLKQAAAGELVVGLKRVLKGERYVSSLIAQKVTITIGKNGTADPATLFGGHLTQRQREVLQLLAEGRSMKEIAGLLDIAVRTVEFHRNSISERLGLHTIAELTRYALEHGHAELPAPIRFDAS